MKLKVEVGPEARDLQNFILEGRNLTNSIIFSGSKWVCELSNFSIDPQDGENDIDIFLLAAGHPQSTCIITVTLDKKKVKVFDDIAFNAKGWLVFIESIKLEEFEDAK
jgi:hypothetical protein